jgi:tetratricopeptide (TPR) repeat protein
VSFDRDVTLKKAEKLLRQGRLEPAIAEYVRVADDDPTDWATANTLGDLYVRAGQADKAVAQYVRVADHFITDGFYPKAAAIYKKVLKLHPEDEATQLRLADISQRQGLLADAKAYLNAVAARRRARGDRAGAAEVVLLLGDVDPNDFEARLLAARTLVEMGDDEQAAQRFRGVYDDLNEKDRQPEALAALQEAVKLNPLDHDGRVVLAKTAVAAGDMEAARRHLDRETAGSDPSLLLALVELEMTAGRFDDIRQLVPQLIDLGPAERERIVELAWATAESNVEGAYAIVEAAVDHAAAMSSFTEAATLLQDFVARVPNHIPALLKLIEVCVDGGLEPAMNQAQGQLADAYLGSGQPTEARVIAEDLVAREPWERTHIDRFRRALVMLRVSEPDAVIAERLSGQSPFVAKDVFATSSESAAVEQPVDQAETAPVEDVPADVPEPAEEQAIVPPAGDRSDRVPLSRLDPPADETPGDHDEHEEIDLTGALLGGGAERAAVPPAGQPSPDQGLADAFSAARQQAAIKTGVDHSAQHMTLARTYLEMGLEDQALGPLEIAAQAPKLRFEAASLLGRIHQKRGNVPQAAHWLERASEAPAPSADESMALQYDLGTMLEANGEPARALAIFLELQAEAGDYHDVAAHIDRLSRLQAETETETGG